jgi:hypothetical protein
MPLSENCCIFTRWEERKEESSVFSFLGQTTVLINLKVSTPILKGQLKKGPDS